MNKNKVHLFLSIIAGLGLGLALTYTFNTNASGLSSFLSVDYGATFNDKLSDNSFKVKINDSTGELGVGTISMDSNYKITTNGGGIKAESTNQPAGYFSSSSGYGLIVNSGNVGIGTPNPGVYKLKVFGDMNVSGGTLLAQGSGTLDSFKAYANNTNSALVAEQVNADGYAVYSTGGKNYFQGNIGIGTSDPKSKLQVNNGYLQIPHLNSTPPAADCDDLSEKGRMTIYGGVGVRPAFAICASGAGNNLKWIYFQCVGYPTCDTAQ